MSRISKRRIAKPMEAPRQPLLLRRLPPQLLQSSKKDYDQISKKSIFKFVYINKILLINKFN
jgi:hypothetical protein